MELVVYITASRDAGDSLLSFHGEGTKNKVLSSHDTSHRKEKANTWKNYLYGMPVSGGEYIDFCRGSSGRHAADNFCALWRRGSSDSDAYDCTVMGNTGLFVSK